MSIRRDVVAIVFVAVCALLPLALQAIGQRQVYWLFVVSELFIFAVVAISLDLLMGRSGQISLGHSGFFAVGAYTAAILNEHYRVDVVLSLLAGGLLSALASLIVGLPATRLRGHYLGIVTLGYGIAVDQIALKWDALTGGDQGIHLHQPTFFGLKIGSPVAMYYISLAVLVVVIVLTWNLLRTRIGRSFAAIRDSEVAAAAMGVPIARTKVLAFVCSAFLAGVAGALYAFLAGFVAPEDFGIDQTLLFFAMVVIGGMGSIAGAIGGTVLVDGLRVAASTVSGLSLAILGGVIVLVVLFAPSGLKGLLRVKPRSR
ncbi:MAG TPA: branched-chain amino acid ABC transporter permease [Candidatus Baltobacteraceae bacterium]